MVNISDLIENSDAEEELNNRSVGFQLQEEMQRESRQDFVVDIGDYDNSEIQKMINEFEAFKKRAQEEMDSINATPAMEIAMQDCSDGYNEGLKMSNGLQIPDHQVEVESLDLTGMEIVIHSGSDENRDIAGKSNEYKVKEGENNEQAQNGGTELDIIVCSDENENIEIQNIINKIMSDDKILEKLEDGEPLPDIEVVMMGGDLEDAKVEDLGNDCDLKELEVICDKIHGDEPWPESEIIFEMYAEATGDSGIDGEDCGKDDQDNGSWFDADGQSEASTDDNDSSDFAFLDIILDVEPDHGCGNFLSNFSLTCCSPTERAQNEIEPENGLSEIICEEVSADDDHIRALKEKYEDAFYFEPDNYDHDQVRPTAHFFNIKIIFILVAMLLIMVALPVLFLLD